MTDDLETILRRGQDRLRGYPLPEPSNFRKAWDSASCAVSNWMDDHADAGAVWCFGIAAVCQIFALVCYLVVALS